ncbi:beta-glucosidase [Acrasis kona]|uniref:Beta-glucosidase n=1 Tax=Acrasis kona TaxID=1008807 RepID=A0AAW2Z557_9EUKA
MSYKRRPTLFNKDALRSFRSIQYSTYKPRPTNVISYILDQNYNVIEDLPPKYNIREMTSIYVQGIIRGLGSTSMCKTLLNNINSFTKHQQQIMVDGSGANWAMGIYTSAVISHLDKDFYSCMNDIVKRFDYPSLQAMLEAELKYLSSDKNPWTQSRILSERPIMVEIDRCLQRTTPDLAASNSPAIINNDYSKFISLIKPGDDVDVTPQDSVLQKAQKSNVAIVKYCNQYILPRDLPYNENTALNLGAAKFELGLCMTAKLCASKISSCMSNGQSIFECITHKDVFECYKK